MLKMPGRSKGSPPEKISTGTYTTFKSSMVALICSVLISSLKSIAKYVE